MELSLRASSIYIYDILCPGPLYLRTNDVMCPWAWRSWLSVGTTSSRFAAPPILPPPVWYTVSRAFMFEDKSCDVSLGLEPSLRAGSLYAYGIMTVGRNAVTSLENAADKRRMRIAFGSVHGIMNYISKAFLLRRASPYVGSARSWTRMRWGLCFWAFSYKEAFFHLIRPTMHWRAAPGDLPMKRSLCNPCNRRMNNRSPFPLLFPKQSKAGRNPDDFRI